jgi:hypothetical protein
MCLIVAKPKGTKNALTKEKFVRAATNNPHGIGIVYKDENGLQVKKFIDTKDKLDEIYKIIENADAYLIHFRYATHGNKDLNNVHPFKVTDNLYVAHNGVLSKYPELNKEWSDTRNFVEGVIKPYVEKHGEESIKSPDFIKWLEDEIGSGNKMAFVDGDMNFTIANEKAGSWMDENWFSNTYSIEDPAEKWKKYYSNSSYNWDDYNYGGNTYDYGYSGNGWYDDYDDYGFERGAYTKEDVLNYVADYIEDGMTSSFEEIPFELDIDKSIYNRDPHNYLKYKKDLRNIADQIRTGATSGKTPIPWELFVDDTAMEYLTTPAEEDSWKDYPEDKQLDLPLNDQNTKLSEGEKQLIYWIKEYNGIPKEDITSKELPYIKSLMNKGFIKERSIVNSKGDVIVYDLTKKYNSTYPTNN